MVRITNHCALDGEQYTCTPRPHSSLSPRPGTGFKEVCKRLGAAPSQTSECLTHLRRVTARMCCCARQRRARTPRNYFANFLRDAHAVLARYAGYTESITCPVTIPFKRRASAPGSMLASTRDTSRLRADSIPRLSSILKTPGGTWRLRSSHSRAANCNVGSVIVIVLLEPAKPLPSGA